MKSCDKPFLVWLKKVMLAKHDEYIVFTIKIIDIKKSYFQIFIASKNIDYLTKIFCKNLFMTIMLKDIYLVLTSFDPF